MPPTDDAEGTLCHRVRGYLLVGLCIGRALSAIPRALLCFRCRYQEQALRGRIMRLQEQLQQCPSPQAGSTSLSNTEGNSEVRPVSPLPTLPSYTPTPTTLQQSAGITHNKMRQTESMTSQTYCFFIVHSPCNRYALRPS